MSKYDPLTDFLKGKAGREVRMSFTDIERVLGQKLPVKSKAVRAWWSNNPSNNVMTQAWLAAGYKTAQVDIAAEMLTFVPDTTGGFGEMAQADFKMVSPPASPPPPPKGTGGKERHPAFGAWRGLVTLLPDYDYTQPAYDEWKELYGEGE